MRAYSPKIQLLVAVAATVLLAACGGSDGPPPNQPPSATISSPDAGASFIEGETVTFQGTATDPEDETLTGSSLRWTSSQDNQIGSGGSFTRSDLSVGTHTIRLIATDSDGDADTASVSITVAANEAPTATIASPSDGATFTSGSTITFDGSATDPEDGTLTGDDLVWTSDLDGQLGTGESFTSSTLSNGTHVITLTATDSQGATGTAQVSITVQPENAPVISSISPDTLNPGTGATISGENFSPDPASNTVTVGGSTVEVTAATATSLEITVPSSVCLPVSDTDVVVTVAGANSAPFAHPFSPTDFVSLGVGELQVVQDPSSFCLQFQQSSDSEQYLVGVQSTSEDPNSLTASRLVGVAGAGSASAGLVSSAAGAGGAALLELLGDPAVQRRLEHRRAELRLRERERELERELLAQGPQPISGPQQIPADVQEGDTLDIRVIDIDASNLCTQFFEIQAVVREIGTRGVWLEDVDNPANGYDATDFQNLSDALDADIYVADSTYFGAPSDIDNNDRIAVVVTKEVNKVGGILGFVFSGDLFPRSSCSSSNESEIYYGIAPDPNGEFEFGALTVEEARADNKNILAHEFVHIIQDGVRLNPPTFENQLPDNTPWEAEGQATLGEEIVGHAVTDRQSRQNYGFNIAFFPHGEDQVRWYIAPFIDLILYYGWDGSDGKIAGAPEECTFLDRGDIGENIGPCLGGRMVYGVPWSLFRWIGDHYGPDYPGGESALFTDMVASTSTGYAMLEELVGVPIETLLSQWAPMLYADDRVSPLDPMLTMPSWDLFNIDQGLSSDANNLESATLNPDEVTFGDFSSAFSVRASSSAYFLVSGSGRPATAIRAEGQDGSVLPGAIQLWIVRMQ